MSARQFSKVSPAVWRSRRFTTLADPWAQLLYLYFLSSEHQGSAGCFRLPDGYASSDLGWPVATYVGARTMLIEADLICFDPETFEYFVLRWFKHCPPMNDNHAASIRRQISELESDVLRELAEAEFMVAEDVRTSKVVRLHSGIANSRIGRGG